MAIHIPDTSWAATEAPPIPDTQHPIPARGLFITLEGPEGGGKTTLAPLVAAHLRARGYLVVSCAEPGGGSIPLAIRQLLLDPQNTGIAPRTELLLFLAARAQLIQDVITPALEAGQVVVSDRYSDSTIAYQAYGSGLPLEDVEAAVDSATDGLWPDLTLLLDVPAEVGLARQGNGNRMEQKGLEYHLRVREGFLEQYRRHPNRIRRIDASQDLERVTAEVLEQVDALIAASPLAKE